MEMNPGKIRLLAAAGFLLLVLLVLTAGAFDTVQRGNGFLFVPSYTPSATATFEPSETPTMTLTHTPTTAPTETGAPTETMMPTDTPVPTATSTPLPTFDETAFAGRFYAQVTQTAAAYLLLQTPTETAVIPDADLSTGLEMINPADGKRLYYIRTDEADNRPGFWIDWSEISNAEYQKCVSAGACTEPAERDCGGITDYYILEAYQDHPVVNITRKQASQYCIWAGMEMLSVNAWKAAVQILDGINGNYAFRESMPAVSDGPDLLGNVWEWTEDHQTPGYGIIVGGSWKTSESDIRLERPAAIRVTGSADDIGFRCIRRIVLQ